MFMSLCLASFDPFYVYEILLCLHVAIICVFLLKHNIPMYDYTMFYLLIYYLGYSQYGAITEIAAVNILVYIFLEYICTHFC